jgi:hypothetical protein
VLNRGHSEPVQGASEPSIANIQLREVSSELLYLETGRILQMVGQPSEYHCIVEAKCEEGFARLS